MSNMKWDFCKVNGAWYTPDIKKPEYSIIDSGDGSFDLFKGYKWQATTLTLEMAKILAEAIKE